MTGRIAEALLVTGALLLLVALTACATTSSSQISTKPCPTPPAALETIDDYDRRDAWMACVPLGWQAGEPQPLYETAGPDEESDDE